MLTLPENRITPGNIAEIKRCLSTHKGDTPVRFTVVGRERTVVYELGFLIDPEPVASDLKSVFGPAIWSVV
jgi:DNA polymerase-3 subunit alpha